MNLQELIDETDLQLKEGQVRAFFLGNLTADHPFSFNEAKEELLTEAPNAEKTLGPSLKELWKSVEENQAREMANLFPDTPEVKEFLSDALEKLDYFLTGFSLGGSSDEQEISDVIDELEDTVMDMDEYLSDEKATKENGEELKELFLGAWEELVELKHGEM